LQKLRNALKIEWPAIEYHETSYMPTPNKASNLQFVKERLVERMELFTKSVFIFHLDLTIVS
jgi:hypothetical protein